MNVRLVACLLPFLAAGCVEFNGRPRGGSDSAPAMLRITVEPSDARVRIDDETVVDARVITVQPVELRQGRHLVTVEAAGFYPHDMALDLPAGETSAVVRLRVIPP